MLRSSSFVSTLRAMMRLLAADIAVLSCVIVSEMPGVLVVSTCLGDVLVKESGVLVEEVGEVDAVVGELNAVAGSSNMSS